jgi:hypothetical protein
MALSPLRPPAAPVQDAPRKISTPPQPQGLGVQKSNAHASTPARGSNPALQSTTGASGFDPTAKTSGRPAISLPTPTGAPQATGGANKVGSIGSTGIDALFNKGSSVFEKILGGLGQSVTPIDDPTARLQARSDQLGALLKSDPSLAGQVSHHDKMQAFRISKIFSNPAIYGALNDAQKAAVQSYQNTVYMLCGAEWPPPPGGGRGNA